MESPADDNAPVQKHDRDRKRGQEEEGHASKLHGGAIDADESHPFPAAIMSTAKFNPDPRAIRLTFTDQELTVELADGRKISAPLAWFPRLKQAKPETRRNWRLIGDGQGIHWPEADEDLSVEGLLRGSPAPGAPKRRLKPS